MKNYSLVGVKLKCQMNLSMMGIFQIFSTMFANFLSNIIFQTINKPTNNNPMLFLKIAM